MWALSRNIDLVFNVFFCIPLLYTMYRMNPTYILSWWMLSSLSSQIDNDPSSLWGAADMLAVQWIVKFLHLSSHKNKVICCSASQKLLSFPVFTYRVPFHSGSFLVLCFRFLSSFKNNVELFREAWIPTDFFFQHTEWKKKYFSRVLPNSPFPWLQLHLPIPSQVQK